MHPALRQHVGPPSVRTGRYLAGGMLTGFAGILLAVAIVNLVDTRRTAARTRELRAELASQTRDLVLARTLANDFARVAFPRWAADHPDRTCPDTVAELASYVGEGVEVDPWGLPFQTGCTRGGLLWARSAGPDRTHGTTDDIGSDR
ncbi:MAG: hypothetical protein IPQ07_03755 [Myxococcales bacterium]|nr:hypothetical protein [Myxococcales bacterium]